LSFANIFLQTNLHTIFLGLLCRVFCGLFSWQSFAESLTGFSGDWPWIFRLT
jgi:hypothetical protein